MFTRLLVPLDGSRLAEAALPVAERLALAFDAVMMLLHVVERGARTTVHDEQHFTDRAGSDHYLHVLVDQSRARGVQVTVHTHDVPEGDVAASIALHATEEHCDLIVLCTHGSSGVRGLLSGSIAQQVLQRGTTPVLLVRPPARGVPTPAFDPHTILVPLDGTTAAEVALGPATTLATKLEARLHLMMVVATPETVRGDRAAVATLLPSATRALLDIEQEQAAVYLRAQAARLQTEGLDVVTEVRRGDTAQQLAGEAAEHGIDLLVASTHGRAGLQAVWAGSTTARLLSRTTTPILLLRTIEA